MASAALCSLASMLEGIQHHGRQFLPLHEKVNVLMDVVADSSLMRRLPLKRQIIEAAHRAKTIIPFEELLKGSRGDMVVEFEEQLQEMINEFDSILKSVLKLRDIDYFVQVGKPEPAMEVKNAEHFEYLARNVDFEVLPEQQTTFSPRLDSIDDTLGFAWNCESCVVGFHEDFLRIEDWLLGSKYHLGVLSIVGMTGTGKTTLARTLFEQPAIDCIFKIHAWVSLSQTNDVKKLFKSILDSVRPLEEELDDKSIEQLKEILYKSLKGNRYFIILDDVWDIQVWDDIRRSFPDDSIRSRIILTTRISEADLKVPFSEIHHMSLLTPKMSWTLFCMNVFGKKDCPQELQDAAETIVKNCGGLPLAIILIAGLLSQASRTKDGWQLIARTMKPMTTSVERLKDILSLSYMYLPHHLRACFRSMIILAEDHELSFPRLTRLWIDEGLINQPGSISPEEVAREFMKDLIDRNLVLACKLNEKGEVEECIISSIWKDFFMAENPDILQILLSTSSRNTRPNQGMEGLSRSYGEGVSMIVEEGLRGKSIHEESLGISFGVLFNSRYTKGCIRYCYLFPTTYEFTKDVLVSVWIAQGATIAGNSVFFEEMCSQCFDLLLKLNYIVPIGYDYTDDGEKYKVGDGMNAFLQNHLLGPRFAKDLDISNINVSELEHLSLSFMDFGQIDFEIIKKLSHLQTLIIHGCKKKGSLAKIPADLFLELKALRMLSLSHSNVQWLPSSIENSKALRFLDMSDTPIRSLPVSMCKLINLETLKLENCFNLFYLPECTKELINLRHLIVDFSRHFTSVPKGIGNLSELRTLRTFLVGQDDGCGISELKSMNKLNGSLLILKLENIKSPDEAADASLCSKRDLKRIKFQWTCLLDEKNQVEEKILTCLEPPLGIQELEIVYYSGGELPSWISMPYFHEMVSITLYMCRYCDNLPSLGQLPSLKFLSIFGMNEVREINSLFCREHINGHQPSFPKLEKLLFYSMHKLEKWTEIGKGDFPCLLNLTVVSCPKFERLPSLACMKSLMRMEINHCPELSCLPDLPPTLERLAINDCPKLKVRCSNEEGEDWSKMAHVHAFYLHGKKVVIKKQGS